MCLPYFVSFAINVKKYSSFFPEKNIFKKADRDTVLNFITEYPDIKPEKCLETSPFIGGDEQENMY